MILIADITEKLSHSTLIQRASAEEFSKLQDQLVQVLAHRLMELADTLALFESGVSKQLLINSARQQWLLPAAFVWEDSPILYEPVGTIYSPTTCDMSTLCGGKLADLGKSCDFYSFHPSSGLREQYNCSAVSPTVPLIMGHDTDQHCCVSEQNISACRICGAKIPDGLSDQLCDSCIFFDWGSWEADTAEHSLADSSLQSNSLTPLQKTNGIDLPDIIRTEIGPVRTSTTVSDELIEGVGSALVDGEDMPSELSQASNGPLLGRSRRFSYNPVDCCHSLRNLSSNPIFRSSSQIRNQKSRFRALLV
jgi:hypothetical protein